MPRGATPDPHKSKRGTGHHGTPKPTPEDELAVREVMAPPEHMAPAAVEAWHLVVAELMRNNQLREIDILSVTMLCDSWYIYAEAYESIKANGSQIQTEYGTKENPACKTIDRERKAINQLSDRLGLTPLSRLRLGLLQLSGQSILSGIDKELGIQVKL